MDRMDGCCDLEKLMGFSESMQHVLSDGFGYAGVLVNLSWPMMQSRRWLLAGQGLACVFMFVHFMLLGAFTGAAIMAVVGTQALLAIPLGGAPRFKLIYLLSLGLIPAVAWFTWQGLPSVFSSVALVFASLGNYQLDAIRQRIGLIMTILAWSVHNALVGSLPGLASNTLGLLVSVTMLVRVYRERARRSEGEIQALKNGISNPRSSHSSDSSRK